MSVEYRAAHEAAHAVVTAAMGCLVGAISVAEAESYSDLDRSMPPHLKAVAAVAGWVGESRSSGQTTNPCLYYEQISYDNRKCPDDYTDLSDAVDTLVTAQKYNSRATAVDAAFEAATNIIADHDDAWRALTEELRGSETLVGPRVRNLLRRCGMNVMEP